MKMELFLLILLSELLLGIALLVSIWVPRMRIWPPPSANSWQFYFTWSLTIFAFLGTVVLGFLDWNNFVLNHWARFVVGPSFVVFGVLFATWGVRCLGLDKTSGIKDVFVTRGPYRYTRNPQYIGDIAVCYGFGIFCNSVLVNTLVLFGTILFLITPFAEEPWLREQYGLVYDNYVEKVPRFWRLGPKSRQKAA